MNHVKLTHDKLSVQIVSDLVSSPKCGAISIFVGTTRDNFEDKTVVHLEYEAYESMAYKSLESVCQGMREKWPNVENIAIYHRLGTVPIKEASVIIAAASPHRIDAMQATQWAIETLKEKVPIWKKEMYVGEEPQWKENKESSTLSKVEPSSEVEVPFVYSHLISSNATFEDILQKAEIFIEQKHEESNQDNIRDFCTNEKREVNNTCARLDAKLIKRKDSKGHLQVNRVLNNWDRDQGNFEYLRRHIPKDGIEERLQNLETQLGTEAYKNDTTDQRLKTIEKRILQLESLSPEYTQFLPFEASKTSPNKDSAMKKYSIEEIDSLIAGIKQKKRKAISNRIITVLNLFDLGTEEGEVMFEVHSR